MILGIYSVRDKAVDAFLPPFFSRAKGEAIRSFASAVSQADHQFAKSKGDFELYSLGTFDDISGVVTSEVGRVISALELGPEGNSLQ